MLLKIIFKEFLQGWSIILDALILYLTYLFITNIFISPESYIKMYKGIADTDSQVELQDDTYVWHTQK